MDQDENFAIPCKRWFK